MSIDTDAQTLRLEVNGTIKEIPLYSKGAFELISEQWLKVGWDQKYTYTFTWLGRPIIQLPEDMIRLQEVIYETKPDVIIETGVAHGGSLVYYASLCNVLGKGRVIGIDIEIRQQNREAIEAHELSSVITLVEGDSTDPNIVSYVRSMVKPDDAVLVILDSSHTKQHVSAELEAYHNLVTPGSYIIATDGIMKDLYDVPRGSPEWVRDNSEAAATQFLKDHPGFQLEYPKWHFNESGLRNNVTYWPSAWLRRR